MRSGIGLGLLVITMTTACKGGGEKTTSGASGQASVMTDTPAASASSQEPIRDKPKALSRESGTIMRSPRDEALYIADEDLGKVHVVALPIDTRNPIVSVKVPGQPAQVLVLADHVLVTVRSEGAIPPGADTPKEDRDKPNAEALTSASASAAAPPKQPKPGEKIAYVRPKMVPSATGPGLLLIMKKDPAAGLIEEKRIELPEDAWAVAITPDESTALVTSAWTHKVSGVDLRTGKLRFSVDVRREPRAVLIHPSGKWAYVTHLVGTSLTRIDGIDGEGASAKTIELPASPLRTPLLTKSNASLAYSATFSPDGKRLLVPRHALGGTGPQVWMGVAAVDVLLTADDTPLAPARTDKPSARGTNAEALWAPDDDQTGGTGPRAAPNVFTQPRAVVYRKSKNTLLVVSEGRRSMVELMAGAIDPSMFVVQEHSLNIPAQEPANETSGCEAPSGVTLSADEETAWVFCRASSSLVIRSLESSSGPTPWIALGEDLLPAEAARGRRLFYTGGDEVVSGGMGCAGCHPDGRDDGHVWHEEAGVVETANFFAGPANIPGWEGDRAKHGGFPRQTPMLAGRLAAEGPYGWHGESPNLAHRISNSFLLHRWGSLPYGHDRKELHDRAMAIRAFLRLGLVPPPKRPRELSEQEKKGKEIFLRVDTKCAGCHVPEIDYSDRASYAIYNKLDPLSGYFGGEEAGFKTPSLLFVGGTAPYSHDGRFATLEDLISQNYDQMGNTKQLTQPEREALVAFLRTL